MNAKTHMKLRTISTFLLITFFAQEISYAAPVARPLELSSKEEKVQLSYAFPASVAQIEDSYKAPDKTDGGWGMVDGGKNNSQSNTLVYLLQDAHTNESGQLNLAKTLEIILKNEKAREAYPPSTIHHPSSAFYVFTEAAVDDNSISFLKPYRPESERKSLAREYIRKGLLHGAEYLQITSDADFKLWGVENPALYIQTIEDYKAVAKDRARFNDYLKQVDATLKTLKPKLMNPALAQLDTKMAQYHKDEISLTDYLEILLKAADVSNLPISTFKNLSLLKKLKDEESRIDFKAANEEQAKAIASLSDLERKEIQDLSDSLAKNAAKLNSSEQNDQKAFFALLEEKLTKSVIARSIATKQSMQSAEIYPNLFKYFAYLKLSRQLEAKHVIDELNTFENAVFESLAKTQDEKALVLFTKQLRLLNKLFAFSLIPAEYAEYKSASPDIAYMTGFLNRKIMDMGTHYERSLFLEPGFNEIVSRALNFYELTTKRDEYFVEKMIEKMHEESLHSPFSKKAVLITGGFHTANLKALLKQKGISYVSITPQVFKETNLKRYEEILLNQTIIEPAGLKIATPATSAMPAYGLSPALPVFQGSRMALQDLAGKKGSQALSQALSAENRFTPSGARLALTESQKSALDEVKKVFGPKVAQYVQVALLYFSRTKEEDFLETKTEYIARKHDGEGFPQTQYSSISGNEELKQRAIEAHVEVMSLDGGLGEKLRRSAWKAWLYSKGFLSGKEVVLDENGKPKLGAKGTDMGGFVVINGRHHYISVSESKLVQLYRQAQEGKFASMSFRPIVNVDSKPSYEALMNKTNILGIKSSSTNQPMTYRELLKTVGVEIEEFLFQEDVPGLEEIAEDGETLLLPGTSLKARHRSGGHGQIGVGIVVNPEDVQLRNDGAPQILAFTNGDNQVSSNISPEIVGHILENDISIGNLVTPAKGVDRKGGKYIVRLIEYLSLKKWIPGQRELAAAKEMDKGTAAKTHEEEFYAAGQKDGEAIFGAGSEGQQPFNTNNFYINLTRIIPFLRELKQVMGESKYLAEVISPNFMLKDKEKGEDGKEYYPVDSAIGNVFHSINDFVLKMSLVSEAADKNLVELSDEQKSIIAVLKKHRMTNIIHYYNVPRALFTPQKNPLDALLQMAGKYYEWDMAKGILKESREGLEPAEFVIVDSKGLAQDSGKGYYSEFLNMLKTFVSGDTAEEILNSSFDVSGLEKLEIYGNVLIQDSIFIGHVRLTNLDQTDEPFDIKAAILSNPGLWKTLGYVPGQPLTLNNVEISVSKGVVTILPNAQGSRLVSAMRSPYFLTNAKVILSFEDGLKLITEILQKEKTTFKIATITILGTPIDVLDPPNLANIRYGLPHEVEGKFEPEKRTKKRLKVLIDDSSSGFEPLNSEKWKNFKIVIDNTGVIALIRDSMIPNVTPSALSLTLYKLKKAISTDGNGARFADAAQDILVSRDGQFTPNHEGKPILIVFQPEYATRNGLRIHLGQLIGRGALKAQVVIVSTAEAKETAIRNASDKEVYLIDLIINSISQLEKNLLSNQLIPIPSDATTGELKALVQENVSALGGYLEGGVIESRPAHPIIAMRDNVYGRGRMVSGQKAKTQALVLANELQAAIKILQERNEIEFTEYIRLQTLIHDISGARFAEFVDIAQHALDSGLISQATFDNIRSWSGPEYAIAHAEIEQEFKDAGDDPQKWSQIEDAWYKRIAMGTAGMRGKRGWGTNRINAFTIGSLMLAQALAVASKDYDDLVRESDPEFDPNKEKKAKAIGYDSRHGSYDPETGGPGQYTKLDALIHLVYGIAPYVARAPMPTPQLAGVVHELDVLPEQRLVTGSMITASHNPRTDTGDKPYKPDGSQSTGAFAALLKENASLATPAVLAGLEYKGINILADTDKAFQIAVDNGDIQWLGGSTVASYDDDAFGADRYFVERELKEAIHSQGGSYASNLIDLQGQIIVISPLHGNGGRILKKIVFERGLSDQVIWVQDEPDPNFNTVKGGKPNPESPDARLYALDEAVRQNAALVLWMDPDSDRPSVAFRKADIQKASSVDDYISLNGNQQLALLADYMIRELNELASAESMADDETRSHLARRALSLVNNWNKVMMASTVVSGDLMKIIARSHGINVVETLTGFKYIGDQIEARAKIIQKNAGITERQWVKLPIHEKIDLALQHSEYFLMGGEESLGALTSDGPHDKDAIAGVLWFVEIFGRLNKQGISPEQRLAEIYNRYGYFAERFPMFQKGMMYGGVTFSEKQAQQDIIPGILKSFRENPPKMIAGKKVIAVLDFEAQTAVDTDGNLLFNADNVAGLVTSDTPGIPVSFGNDLRNIPVPDNDLTQSDKRAVFQGIYSFSHAPYPGQENPEKLPKENFIMLILEDGSKIIARPSGTEPVLKLYILMRGLLENIKEVDSAIELAVQDLDHLMDEVARSIFPDRFSNPVAGARLASATNLLIDQDEIGEILQTNGTRQASGARYDLKQVGSRFATKLNAEVAVIGWDILWDEAQKALKPGAVELIKGIRRNKARVYIDVKNAKEEEKVRAVLGRFGITFGPTHEDIVEIWKATKGQLSGRIAGLIYQSRPYGGVLILTGNPKKTITQTDRNFPIGNVLISSSEGTAPQSGAKVITLPSNGQGLKGIVDEIIEYAFEGKNVEMLQRTFVRGNALRARIEELEAAARIENKGLISLRVYLNDEFIAEASSNAKAADKAIAALSRKYSNSFNQTLFSVFRTPEGIYLKVETSDKKDLKRQPLERQEDLTNFQLENFALWNALLFYDKRSAAPSMGSPWALAEGTLLLINQSRPEIITTLIRDLNDDDRFKSRLQQNDIAAILTILRQLNETGQLSFESTDGARLAVAEGQIYKVTVTAQEDNSVEIHVTLKGNENANFNVKTTRGLDNHNLSIDQAARAILSAIHADSAGKGVRYIVNNGKFSAEPDGRIIFDVEGVIQKAQITNQTVYRNPATEAFFVNVSKSINGKATLALLLGEKPSLFQIVSDGKQAIVTEISDNESKNISPENLLSAHVFYLKNGQTAPFLEAFWNDARSAEVLNIVKQIGVDESQPVIQLTNFIAKESASPIENFSPGLFDNQDFAEQMNSYGDNTGLALLNFEAMLLGVKNRSGSKMLLREVDKIENSAVKEYVEDKIKQLTDILLVDVKQADALNLPVTVIHSNEASYKAATENDGKVHLVLTAGPVTGWSKLMRLNDRIISTQELFKDNKLISDINALQTALTSHKSGIQQILGKDFEISDLIAFIQGQTYNPLFVIAPLDWKGALTRAAMGARLVGISA